MRDIRPDIKAIDTATQTIMLSAAQYFCKTPKAYEIWDKSLGLDPKIGMRIKRIPATKVFWVYTN